jgi:hypothetical protein
MEVADSLKGFGMLGFDCGILKINGYDYIAKYEDIINGCYFK